MKTLLTIISLLALVMVSPALAAKKGAQQSSGELKIVEVDAVSVKVTVGKSGDEHFTYRITDNTKVTLNGAPAFARDLKAGMVAKFTLTPDHATATVIEAKDPPARTRGNHVG